VWAKTGALCFCLLMLALFQGGCSETKLVRQVETVRVLPPAGLLLAPEPPLWNGTSNGDLLDYTVKLEAALLECLTRFKALREWAGGANE
jgi:hypothetical protein